MTTTETELFDATSYDLEGTPRLNGHKAAHITIAFATLELDRTNADHMELAGKLETGDPVNVTVELQLAQRTWNEKPTETGTEISVTYRIQVTDIDA